MARRTTTRARAQRFARQLHGRFGLPVHEVDERYTHAPRRWREGARDVDAAAAALILEQFLEEPAHEHACSLDAEALYAELLARRARMLLQPDTALVGIWSGGAWLAERLQRDLRAAGRAAASSRARCTATTSRARGLAGGSDADAAAVRRRRRAASC